MSSGHTLTVNIKVTEVVTERLEECALRDSYNKEEPYLLEHVVSEIESAIGDNYDVVSQSWKDEDSVVAFGGSFWPDVIVKREGEDLLAIELKLVKEGRSPTKAIAETTG